MKKVLRACLALVITLGVFTITPPVNVGVGVTEVFAGTQGSVCPSGNYRAHFYENAIGDTTHNNDSLWLCTSGHSNFSFISHTLAGTCNAGGALQNTWNDCISSAAFTINPGFAVCLYNDAGYSGAGMRVNQSATGTRVNMSFGTNDEVSSYRYIDSAFAC